MHLLVKILIFKKQSSKWITRNEQV